MNRMGPCATPNTGSPEEPRGQPPHRRAAFERMDGAFVGDRRPSSKKGTTTSSRIPTQPSPGPSYASGTKNRPSTAASSGTAATARRMHKAMLEQIANMSKKLQETEDRLKQVRAVLPRKASS